MWEERARIYGTSRVLNNFPSKPLHKNPKGGKIKKSPGEIKWPACTMAHGGNEVVTKTLTTSHESFIAMSPFLSQKKKKKSLFRTNIFWEEEISQITICFFGIWNFVVN